MRQSLPIGKEPNLQKIIITSAVLHLIFITLITIPLKSKDREYKTYFVNVVTPAQIQTPSRKPAVKKKGKAAKSSTSLNVKPAPRRRVQAKKGVSLEPVETKRVSREIERLRAISALEKKKKSKEEAMARARDDDESVEQAIEGIKKRKTTITVSTGMGIPGAQASIDSESYYALITQKIWGEWVYPDLDMSDLEVVMSIKIDSSGEIVSHYIEKTSGNKIFDRSASKAIIKASPLPSPPVEMEVGVRFRL